MRNKKQSAPKIYIGARVPRELKEKLTKRADRERRSEAAIIELLLTKELATE